MRNRNLLLTVTTALLLGFLNSVAAIDTGTAREWKIEGVARQALLFIPGGAKTNPAPVVFFFHGHGDNIRRAAQAYGFQTQWPEAVVVYMQGLNTPGHIVDREGKSPGWQGFGAQGDRDLKFFDAVLETLRQEYHVDDKRIYSTGHSNGAYFTYLLWATRGDKLAAVAPSAGIADPPLWKLFQPKPVMHIAGQNDPLVKYEWQQMTIEKVWELNQCSVGEPWGDESSCTLYPSKSGAPVVTYIHNGKHGYPGNTSARIVKFFQQHTLP